jgi:hypothetical protein
VHPVADRFFGPAFSLLCLVSLPACNQFLDGLALLFGLADARGGGVFGGLGLVKWALPVPSRVCHGSGQGGGQSLPIAFAGKAASHGGRSSRSPTVFSFIGQDPASLFGR